MGRIIPSVTGLLLVFVTSKAFDVEIAPADRIAAQIGDKFVLTCSTTDCETPRFSWRTQLDNPLGGTVNSKGNISILTMDPVGLKNEHDYLCEAFCDNEKKEKNIKVDVYSFPSDPVLEISTPLNVGENASVTCMVAKVYPCDRLEMQLVKDGSVLASKEFSLESSQTTQTKKWTMNFIPIFEDIGKEITCVAELLINEMEFEPKKRQTSQRLSVNFGPRNTNITISPSNTIKEGDTLMLTCRSESNPPAGIVWGKELENSNVQHIIDNDTLIIPHAQMSDSGLFICEAMNDAMNKTERTTVAISVQVVPRITEFSIQPSTTVQEGDDVTIICSVESNPAARIVLRRKSDSEDTVLYSKDGIVHIPNVMFLNAGNYECEAENALGKSKMAAALSVESPPQNTAELIYPSDNVDEEEYVTIMSTTYSNPPSQIVLQEVHPSKTTMLSSQKGTSTLYRVIKNYTGTFPVLVYNEAESNTDGIEMAVVESLKKTDYMIPVIVMVSCLSTMGIPVLAILIYVSRKANINGSYCLANALKPNV